MLHWMENQLPEGWEIEVTEALRTYEEYKRLYPGKTRADFSENRHARYLALDIKAVRKYDSPCITGSVTINQLADLARRAGFKGIGIYDKHLHIDLRVISATWKGESK